MSVPRSNHGFSTVELLIALFVAALFLLTGYQLYGAVIRDSGESRQRARASNIAQDYLRRYAAQVPTTCTVNASWLANQSITADGLANVRVSVARTCPDTGVPSLSKVETRVTYGEDQTVTHAIYARP